MKQPIEEWKNVNHPVFKDFYQVSNLGRLKVKGRFVDIGLGRGYWKDDKIITSFRRNNHPHLFTSLYSTVDGYKNKTAYIHKLVAEAFIERPSEDHVYVTHIDGNYSNNNASNLKWITASENSKNNIIKYPENGLKLKKHNVKVGYYDSLRHPIWKKKNLKRAIKMLKWGVSKEEVARIFGCSQATIYNVIKKQK
jgi:hypothetical protein